MDFKSALSKGLVVPPTPMNSHTASPTTSLSPLPSPTIKLLKIGIDYGNVCSSDAASYENESNDNELGINVPDCLSTLRQLRDDGHSLYLVSFCGKKRAMGTKAYFATLEDNPFTELFFVKAREHKKYICQRFGLDVMIDDRTDILESIKDTQTMQFTQYVDPRHINHGGYKPDFRARDWNHAYQLLSNTVQTSNLSMDPSVNIAKYCY